MRILRALAVDLGERMPVPVRGLVRLGSVE